jgi:D-glycero-D-manno-heptose 1,7-bisphosphate phosphatase
MTKPVQAVILCGGLGTRMRPFTDTMPKPMALVNGKPFLGYLIAQLREQGIERVLLLTGYRGEAIRDYFGAGAKWNVAISYSHGPAEWETGRRIWEAREQLDPRFVLLYSDNFVPFNLDKQTKFHETATPAISLLVQRKVPGNIRLRDCCKVDLYDSSRAGAGLDYVEIGYMIVERDSILARFNNPDVSFSTILAALARRGELAAVVSADSYHSVSDPGRWKLAEQYLAPKKILMIDRDGTINRRPGLGAYLTRWEDFAFIEENVEAMVTLAKDGYRFIVISNQAGIGRGIVDRATVEDINRRMVAGLKERGIEILDVYICPHHWDDHCDCRKPAPGMFFRASREHLLRMTRSIYIGDDPRDAVAAYNAECPSVLVGPERDLDPGNGVTPTFKSPTLLGAVPWIEQRFDAWAQCC